MAFDYQSLKKVTGAAIVDGSLAQADLANTTVTGTNIATGAVGSDEMATGAVDLGSAKATGALSVAQGGLGINSGSGAYRAVRSTGSALTTDQHGIASMNVYTGNSTWSRPSGVRYPEALPLMVDIADAFVDMLELLVPTVEFKLVIADAFAEAELVTVTMSLCAAAIAVP